MYKQSQFHHILSLLTTLSIGSIGILMVYGAPWNKTCNIDITEATTDGFKKDFGNKLYDNLGKEYLKLIIKNFPKGNQFYKSLMPELPADDKHTEVIQYVLQKSEKYERDITIPEDKEGRLRMINEIRKLNSRCFGLFLMETDKVSPTDFQKLAQKHNVYEFTRNMISKQAKLLENMQKIWKQMYDCIPEEYLREYTEFDEAEDLFQELVESKDINEKLSKGYEVLSQLEEFFGNEMNFFEIDPNLSDDLEDTCILGSSIKTAEDFKRNFGVKLYDNLGREYPKANLRFEQPTDDKHIEIIKYLVRNSAEYSENMDRDETKDYKLSDLSSRDLRFDLLKTEKEDFQVLQENHSGKEFIQNTRFEYLNIIENMQKIWKEMYDCIPEKYLKKYTEFGVLEDSFQELMQSTDDNEKLRKGYEVFTQLEEFFDNGINSFNFNLNMYEDEA